MPWRGTRGFPPHSGIKALFYTGEQFHGNAKGALMMKRSADANALDSGAQRARETLIRPEETPHTTGYREVHRGMRDLITASLAGFAPVEPLYGRAFAEASSCSLALACS